MSHELYIIIGILFPFVMNISGALTVYFFKKEINPKLNILIIGFSAGVMLAASIWSLILPALEFSEDYGAFSFVPASIGFILGGLFLFFIGRMLARREKNSHDKIVSKSKKIFWAVTIHNIPEGLVIGLALGLAWVSGDSSLFVAAFALAMGIGIQNLPESAAVAFPMISMTGSKNKAFFIASLSGIFEISFSVIGFFLASVLASIMPWLLAFAAGAMIYVCAEELIPDTKHENTSLGTWGFMIGFVIMMILDVALG